MVMRVSSSSAEISPALERRTKKPSQNLNSIFALHGSKTMNEFQQANQIFCIKDFKKNKKKNYQRKEYKII